MDVDLDSSFLVNVNRKLVCPLHRFNEQISFFFAYPSLKTALISALTNTLKTKKSLYLIRINFHSKVKVKMSYG